MLIDESNDELLDRITGTISILSMRLPLNQLRDMVEDTVSEALETLDEEQ